MDLPLLRSNFLEKDDLPDHRYVKELGGMENERLEQYRGAVGQILARRGWGLVQDEEAFIGEVFTDVERRLTQLAPQSGRRLAKVIEDATINRYGHIWHSACGASGTVRQHQAFSELNQYLFGVAYRVAHNNKYIAEESTQEALISIFKSLSQIDDPGRFLRWVQRIIRRQTIKLLQREKERLGQIDESPNDPDGEGQNKTGVIEFDDLPLSEREELRARFEKVIKHCLKRSKHRAKVIIRLLLDERSSKEVADELGIKVRSIYRIKDRAKNSLRKCKEFLKLAESLQMRVPTVAKGE